MILPKLHCMRFRYIVKRGINVIRKRSTIFAISTSSGLSAVSVIRVSGPNAKFVPFSVAGFKKLPLPRTAFLRKFKDPVTKEILDKGILIWFPGPKSFTGEDVCELHIHGGTAVKRTILKALQKLPTFCHAEPGEFTKRAFLAGKLDLTEVEGLADLLHAETEAQQKQALRQMDGSLHRLYSHWTELIKMSLAKLEAYIDFSEDQNLDSDLLSSVKTDIELLNKQMTTHLKDNRRGETLRNGINAVLVGRPNVGKSSLINILCQRDVAIVSPIPGTTRDIIEKSVNLDGYLVHLSDTAGIRVGQDAVEEEGLNRAYKRSLEADVLLFLVEAETAMSILPINHQSSNDVEYFLSQELGQNYPLEKIKRLIKEHRVILIFNKADLLSVEERIELQHYAEGKPNVLSLSCLSGDGLSSFYNKFSDIVQKICAEPSAEEPTITQERHRHHVEKCVSCLDNFLQNEISDVVISAEYLRQAVHQLGKITGEITTEDILNVIFKDFCIGK